MAIERTTSKAKIEVISRVWSSCLQGSQSCRKLDPRKRTQQVPRSRTRLPALPKTRTQTNGTTINNEKCASNMMQNMYDMQDMICDAYACSGRKMMNMAVTWQTKHATGKMR
jgi:hypothetical protein